MMENTYRKYAMNTAAAVAWEIRVPEAVWTVVSIQAELSAAPTTGAQNFTLTLDSEEGPLYDTPYFTQDLVGETGLVWAPTGEIPVAGATNKFAGDRIDVAFPNTDVRDIGIIIWLKRLGAR